jgi:hypothetical protein
MGESVRIVLAPGSRHFTGEVVNEGVALFKERAQERSNLCWKVAGKTLHPLCSRRPSDVRRNVIGSNMLGYWRSTVHLRRPPHPLVEDVPVSYAVLR